MQVPKDSGANNEYTRMCVTNKAHSQCHRGEYDVKTVDEHLLAYPYGRSEDEGDHCRTNPKEELSQEGGRLGSGECGGQHRDYEKRW